MRPTAENWLSELSKRTRDAVRFLGSTASPVLDDESTVSGRLYAAAKSARAAVELFRHEDARPEAAGALLDLLAEVLPHEQSSSPSNHRESHPPRRADIGRDLDEATAALLHAFEGSRGPRFIDVEAQVVGRLARDLSRDVDAITSAAVSKVEDADSTVAELSALSTHFALDLRRSQRWALACRASAIGTLVLAAASACLVMAIDSSTLGGLRSAGAAAAWSSIAAYFNYLADHHRDAAERSRALSALLKMLPELARTRAAGPERTEYLARVADALTAGAIPAPAIAESTPAPQPSRVFLRRRSRVR